MDEEFNKEQIERLISSLGPLPASFDNLANAIKNNAAAQTDSGKKVKESGTLFKDVLTHMTEATEDSTESTKKRTAAEKSAFNNSVDALENFGSALTTSHPTLSTFKSTVQSGTDAVADMASQIPLFGEAISMAIKAIGAVTGAYFDQFDQQNAFGSEMRKMGVTVSTLSDGTVLTTDKLTDMARESGYTADKLGELAGIMAGAGPAIALFGSGMSEGTAEFMKYTKLSVANQMQMKQLGYTYEEVNEVQTAYLELQRASGINLKAQNVTAETLQKRSLDYAKSLIVISELTGKSAEEQMKAQQVAAADIRNKLYNISVQDEINRMLTEESTLRKAGNDAAADEIKSKREGMAQDLASRTALTQELAKLGFDSETMIGLQTAMITGTIDSSNTLISQLQLSASDLADMAKGVTSTVGKDGKVTIDQESLQALTAKVGGMVMEGQESATQRFGPAAMFMGEDATGFIQSVIGGQDARQALQDGPGSYEEKILKGGVAGAKTKEPGIDYQLTFQAALEVSTRAVKSFSDGLLDKSLPLVIAGTVGAMAALTVATFKGAKALAAMGLPIGKAITGMVSTAASAVKTGFSTAAKSAVKTGVSGGGAGALTGLITSAAAVLDGVNEHKDTNRLKEEGVITEEDRKRRNSITKMETTGEVVGAGVGAVGGGMAGAQAGAMLGAFGGPLGIAIGGTLGGLIGAGLGAWALSSAGEELGETIGGNVFAKLDGEVAKASLDLAKSGGLYQEKGAFQDSTIDFEKLETMMTDNTLTPEMIQAILEKNDVSKADEKELYKALNALNKTIVVASNGTIVPALDSGGKLAIGEIGLVGEKGPELVQGPADVTSRAETGEKIAAMMNTIDMLKGEDPTYDKIEGRVLSGRDTSEEIARLMAEAMEMAGLKGSITAEEVMASQASDEDGKVEHLMAGLGKKSKAMGAKQLDTSGAWDIELDDVSTPTVDIAPKEVPKPEGNAQGSPQLAGDLDKQDTKADENLKLLADLGMMLGRLDRRMEEQNSLTEKIVQYSSV
jgi:hypothetical protein